MGVYQQKKMPLVGDLKKKIGTIADKSKTMATNVKNSFNNMKNVVGSKVPFGMPSKFGRQLEAHTLGCECVAKDNMGSTT